MGHVYNKLTEEEARVIVHRGTEMPFSGLYDTLFQEGTYICRRCNNPLFSSRTKFEAGCGWPAFDDHFPGAVTQVPDPDGSLIEIRCSVCGGHLGHMFTGERMTKTNVRHCVNSLSLRFVPEGSEKTDITEKLWK